MEDEMKKYQLELEAAMEAALKSISDAGIKIKSKGYMAENILVINFRNSDDFNKGLTIATSIENANISNFPTKKRIAIIF